jgi:hypothetical protein
MPVALIGWAWLAACERASRDGEAESPAVCDAGLAAPPPRQLRLLTRREYDATVADLLPDAVGAGGACRRDADCDWADESCVAGTCDADPCEVVTFAWPGGPHGSVVVAGSFNGWGATAAAGGWEASWDEAIGAHVTKRAVPDGDHAYKFVVDGVWLADPTNPAAAPDGYGGQNSVLRQACAGAPTEETASTAPSAGFPVESRPQHYPFDNHAASGLVTSVHVERYADAAERLAAAAVADPDGLLGCDATSDDCVRGWLRAFGRRAWRRPLADAEVERLRGLVVAAEDRADGLSIALQVLLQSPFFLYRSETGVPVGPADWQLDPYETATALSYFLWGTTPDDALLDAAAAGALSSAAGREAEARRLLADPRARDQLATLAAQWLGVEGVPDEVKSASAYPAWTPALGRSMVDETRAFVTWVAFDGPGRYRDLLLSDTTFVDDPALAALYGIDGTGAVRQPAGRVGLLGHASVLTATSHSDQSSPILRGLLVRERLLCQPFPAPPANVGPVPAVDPDATTRERFEQHADDPACVVCHERIDPIGFGLEGFDGVGAARDAENGLPLDLSGQIVDLEGPDDPARHAFEGQAELAALLADADAARRCFATQLYRYATGGLESEAQTCAIASIDAAAPDGDLVDLLAAVVAAPDFVRRAP